MGHPYQGGDVGHPQYPYIAGGPPRPVHHMQQPVPAAKPLARPVSQQSVISGTSHQPPRVSLIYMKNN